MGQAHKGSRDFIDEKGFPSVNEAKVNQDYTLKDISTYNAYTVEEGVYGYSTLINADAIAMPTHGRRGLAHFFSGSISEDLVNHSKLPVVTFKM